MKLPLGSKKIILNRLHDTGSSPLLNIFWKLKRQEQNFRAVNF
jgi:hypothetical protein